MKFNIPNVRLLFLALIVAMAFPAMPVEAATETPITFAVITDMHLTTGDIPHLARLNVSQLNSLNPDFTIELGDAIAGGATEEITISQYSDFEGAYRNLIMPRYYVIGNHEVVSGWTHNQNVQLWIDKTEATAPYYSFDLNGFHFIVLDTATKPDRTQLNWLESDLASTSAKTIVFSHRPIATYPDIEWDAGEPRVQSLLEADGDVIAVFNGHFHLNNNTVVNGINHCTITHIGGNENNIAMVTLYSGGQMEIRGYNGQESYYPPNSSYIASNWSYRKKISFNAHDVSKNLIDFPLEVHLTATKINFNHILANGEDIRFIDNSGMLLPYEIERWDDMAGDAIVWVKVPQIDSNSTTDHIWMYYGNTGARDAQDAKRVWGDYQVINRFNSLDGITGTSLSLGVYEPAPRSNFSVRDTVSSPRATTNYITTYNPSGTWDFSRAGLNIDFWLKSNRASSAYSSARLYLYDASNNCRYHDLQFAANTWTNMVVLAAGGKASATTPPAMTAIDKITIEFVAADALPFQKDISWAEIWIEASNMNRTGIPLTFGPEKAVTFTAVATLSVTDVYTNGGTHATLRGNLEALGSAPPVDIWFEWGYTTGYGKVAGAQTVNSTGTYSANLTGYDPNETVHYRFVAQDVEGIIYYGEDMSFKVAKTVGDVIAEQAPFIFLFLAICVVLTAVIVIARKHFRQR